MEPDIDLLAASGKSTEGVQSPTVLTYHTVAEEPSAYIYSVSCRQFDEHLAWITSLHEQSRKPVPIPEVTFDDGVISDHRYALPLLSKHGCRAKFFVVAGFIGVRSDFMTWQQVREISAAGHSIQAHGMSHLLLTRANASELVSELDRSKKEIEDRLGFPVLELSLPGGRWNETVLRACAEVGFQRVYHSDPWKDPDKKYGMQFVGRLMVRNSMDVARLRAIVAREPGAILQYRTQHILKEAGKKLIGDQAYHWLWKQVAKVTRKDQMATNAAEAREAGNRTS